MLDFAILGCGRIAKRHSELLGHNQIKGARLAAVCDKVEDKARTVGERFGVPWFTDLDQMMNSVKVDVVSVLTESGNHSQDAINVANYGKHVVVEKPMALTLADADAMIAACKAAGVKLFVVKQNRFNRPVAKLRE